MPLVSIVILTFNRINVLIDIIYKLKNLTYKNVEIIIINNNSSDETKIKIPEMFPEINLINLDKNIGVSALNYGLKAASGEYVLQLDDDSYPEDKLIEEGLKEFSKNNKLGVIAFKVMNLRYGICETEEFPENPRTFNGCGVMFRSEIFIKTGYYNDNIFIYYNELDLSIRVINIGYEILYFKEAVVFHLHTSAGREVKNIDPFKSEFRFKYYFLSYFVFLYTNFNRIYVVKYGIKLFVSNMIKAIYFGYYKAFFLTLLNIIKFTIKKYSCRIKISKKTQNIYENGNFALIDRIFFPTFEKNKLYKWIKRK
jgi:GT2 family glycosyltransferase